MLYKQLNEQRTQGELIVNDDSSPDYTLWNKQECIATVWANDKTEANAQYAALAINNLHILAEALDAIIASAFTNSSNTVEIGKKELRMAKEALNRIS